MRKLIFCLTATLLLDRADANCRSIADSFQQIGNVFVPNPLKLEAGNGVITSSNYPNNYNSNEQCSYLIEAPPGLRIRLEFTDYNVAGEAIFGVFDGPLTPFGGVFNPFPVNSSVVPSPFESNTNFIGINFSTGNDNQTGWRLLYSAVNGEAENEQPLLVLDSSTTTFFMAVLSVVVIFLSGFIPPA